ncbi:MAG: STAS domain-containing protein [Actinomycetota bacterium]
MAAPKDSPTTPVDALPPAGPRAIVLAIPGPIALADVPGLCDRVRGLLEDSDADLVVYDVRTLDPDVATLEALARLQLTARRLGRRVRLSHASGELQDLLALAGLCDVVGLCGRLRFEPRGQAEQREQARRVEEEADPGDPTA